MLLTLSLSVLAFIAFRTSFRFRFRFVVVGGDRTTSFGSSIVLRFGSAYRFGSATSALWRFRFRCLSIIATPLTFLSTYSYDGCDVLSRLVGLKRHGGDHSIRLLSIRLHYDEDPV